MRNRAQANVLPEQTAGPTWWIVHWPPKRRQESAATLPAGDPLAQQQDLVATAALAVPSRIELQQPMASQVNHGREKAGVDMTVLEKPRHRLGRSISCPYCRAATYNLSYEVYAAGILASGECTSCGTRGRSFTESMPSRTGPARRRAPPPI